MKWAYNVFFVQIRATLIAYTLSECVCTCVPIRSPQCRLILLTIPKTTTSNRCGVLRSPPLYADTHDTADKSSVTTMGVFLLLGAHAHV